MAEDETSQGQRGLMLAAFNSVYNESGLRSLLTSTFDVKILCLQRFVRQFAYGQTTLILVSFFTELNFSKERIGLFMTLTLAGDILISFFLALYADRVGRRAILACGAALMVASGIIFALSSNYLILLAAAVAGVISPRCV
jgi:MFS family permease